MRHLYITLIIIIGSLAHRIALRGDDDIEVDDV